MAIWCHLMVNATLFFPSIKNTHTYCVFEWCAFIFHFSSANALITRSIRSVTLLLSLGVSVHLRTNCRDLESFVCAFFPCSFVFMKYLLTTSQWNVKRGKEKLGRWITSECVCAWERERALWSIACRYTQSQGNRIENKGIKSTDKTYRGHLRNAFM